MCHRHSDGMTLASSDLARGIVTRKRVLAAVVLIAVGVWAAETGWIALYSVGIAVAVAEQGIAWLVRRRRST
jgi:hypothetical protein